MRKNKGVRTFSEIVDSVISSGWGKQLLALAMLTVVAFLVSWILVSSIGHLQWQGKDLHQSFWLTICYFFDPGNLNLTEPNSFSPQWIVSIVVAILGMTILTGLFISTFTNIIEQRVNAVKNGLVTYKGINNHSVVIGFNELSESVLRGLLESRETGDKIILLTNHDMVTVRKSLYGLTKNKLYEGRIVLYSGDYRYLENLSRLNIDRAKQIYILGDDDMDSRDFENIACAQRISKLIEEKRNGETFQARTTPMFVRMDRMPSFSTMQRIDFQSDFFSKSVYFRPFNYYEHWTRLLWVKHEADVYDLSGVKKRIMYPKLTFSLGEGTDKYIHVIVSGFSQMGMALVLHVLRAAHFSNYTEANELKTKITIVDPNLDTLKPLFLSQYKHLEQIYDVDIDYRNCMLEELSNELVEWCTDRRQMVTIAICLSDNDVALSQSLNLPLEAYYQKGRNSDELPRILVRQRSLSGIWKMLYEKEHEELIPMESDKDSFRKGKYNKYHNLYPFGMVVSGFYPDDLDDLKACLVHADYEDKWLYKNKSESERITIDRIYHLVEKEDDKELKELILAAIKRWYAMSENVKWANRYQADNHHVLKDVLHSMGIVELADLDASGKAISICSDIEHRRWVGERVVSGWQQSPYLRDGSPMRQDSLLLHYDITKTSKIGNEAVKDQNVVKNVLMLDAIYNYVKNNQLLTGS